MERELMKVNMFLLEKGDFEQKHTIDATAQELLLGDDKMHVQLSVPFAIAEPNQRISGKVEQIIHIDKKEKTSFKAFMEKEEDAVFAPILAHIQKLIATITKEVWYEEQNWEFSAPKRMPRLHVVENNTKE